jgi:hypothetical protein
MQNALIFGTVILTAIVLYTGTQLTGRFKRRWLWGALAIGVAVYIVLLRTQTAAWLVSDIVVILVSLLAASAIGLTLSSSSALIVFCITAGIVDFFSFSGGLTDKIITDYQQGQNLLLQYLSITIPLNGRLLPIIGIGDLVILGSIYYALRQLGHDSWLAFLFPLGGLLTALTLGLWLGGIYALPFIGGATIFYLFWTERKSSSTG